MANTFKFGNGNWAVKEDYALAYNDENNNFKPLPFDFTRASSATRVNKQGLIETVGSGKPRIDFLDNTKGHLLLEPSRTNIITNSEQFVDAPTGNTNMDVFSGTIINNDTTSPDGNNNGMRFTANTATGAVLRIYQTDLSTSADTTFTIYAKKGTTDSVSISITGGTATSVTLTDEWQRISVTSVSTSSKFLDVTFTASVGQYIYIFGMQAEAASYATSYIPTSGSAVTRTADDISLTLPDNASFNSSVGFSVVSKFDIGAAGTGTSAPFILFNDDTSSTYIGFGSNSSNLRCRLNLSGTAYLNTQLNAPRTQRNSLFISCDANGWSQGANGVTNHTGNNDASVFNKMASITYTTSEVYGIIKISELLIYNTRLSDSELQQLTS